MQGLHLLVYRRVCQSLEPELHLVPVGDLWAYYVSLRAQGPDACNLQGLHLPVFRRDTSL